MLGLGSLRLKIVAFTLLSLIGGLSQAVLLVLISEVAVAGVEGRHSFHALGRTLSSTDAIILAFVALTIFFVTSVFGALLSTSVSAQALTAARERASSPGSSGPTGPCSPPSGSGTCNRS